ncbi:MAG: tRNA (adenosine(37)-N6)-threonylcarbamoyltransferase complex transferase subunit TsaD [Alphaproteobacteria bacterium]|nr:tRNA (adenosine(37)-N6)-threonylcarbamoyltransferase complex transferase subunit TsaD [Alphaproteobacteria bacterium]
MIVLGIETSCDETAAAVVTESREILANKVLSQLAEHAPYGGVVPEIAARSHLDHIDRLVAQAMEEAAMDLAALDGIAVTGGPGLIGGVMVGAITAKTLAQVLGKPLINVNHLEAHALSVRLVEPGADFPYLLLLVTGGHCQLVSVEDVGRYTVLGTTIDDAIGEAFDKTAKMLGLPYPGGPAIEAAAKRGNAARFDLPRPMLGRPGCDFSFSGLKTAVAQTVDRLSAEGPGAGELSAADIDDVAASFQAAAAATVLDRARNALAAFRATHPGTPRLVVAGGVAANRALRTALEGLAGEAGAVLSAPPPELCTDNAAMVAWAGVERLGRGLTDPLDFAPRPRWPLGDVRAEPA